MLLNCVLRRALTPPFGKNPPDGVLNNFPRDLYLNNKGTLLYLHAQLYTYS